MGKNPKYHPQKSVFYYNAMVDLFLNMKGEHYKPSVPQREEFVKITDDVRKLANRFYKRILKVSQEKNPELCAKDRLDPRSDDPRSDCDRLGA